MPKTTHQHQEDSTSTDRKFRPDDESEYTRDKQEFQASEKAKKETKLEADAPEFPSDTKKEE
jgi:hypothetical protein